MLCVFSNDVFSKNLCVTDGGAREDGESTCHCHKETAFPAQMKPNKQTCGRVHVTYQLTFVTISSIGGHETCSAVLDMELSRVDN